MSNDHLGAMHDGSLPPVATQVDENDDISARQQELARTRAEMNQLQEMLREVPKAQIVATGDAKIAEIKENPNKRKCHLSRRNFILLAIFALVVIIAAVVSGVLVAKNNDNDKNGSDPGQDESNTGGITSAPAPTTNSPIVSPAPTVSRKDQILQQLIPISGEEAFSDGSSAQFLSMDWLVNTDEAKLAPDDPNLLQRYVLALFYFSTNMHNTWQNDFNFLSNRPSCDWNNFESGVACNFEGEVIELRLSDNGLQGTLPSELAYLIELKHLLFGRNSLSGTLPSELGTLKQLERFTVWISRTITGTLPTEYGNLESLVWISIGGNKISGPIPSEYGNLPKLTQLDFFNNELSGPFPSELGLLPNLEKLSIYHNQLTGDLNPIYCDDGGLFSMSADCGTSGLITCDCCHGCY